MSKNPRTGRKYTKADEAYLKLMKSDMKSPYVLYDKKYKTYYTLYGKRAKKISEATVYEATQPVWMAKYGITFWCAHGRIYKKNLVAIPVKITRK